MIEASARRGRGTYVLEEVGLSIDRVKKPCSAIKDFLKVGLLEPRLDAVGFLLKSIAM